MQRREGRGALFSFQVRIAPVEEGATHGRRPAGRHGDADRPAARRRAGPHRHVAYTAPFGSSLGGVVFDIGPTVRAGVGIRSTASSRRWRPGSPAASPS